MICLLRVGFDQAEESDETLFAPVTDRLGNYRIEHGDDGTACELGRGAMGVTYRAVDTSLQRPVALKLIASEWVKRGAEARERFMREARTAASLRHPNVATVYHFGIREENGQCFCAMELVEGETLETRVRRTGPLDALTTIEIALQVSSALAAAEKQGLVHRDLKPANLMVVEAAPPLLSSSNDNATIASHSSRKNATGASHLLVKVIDFGVAKALVEKPDAMGLTHGGFVGTPAFASPEQFTDAAVDVRSDIYSLGATLWYLLTGRRPFRGATIEQIRASQHSRALPIEQLKAAHVPSHLISLLVSMLASEPAARPSVRALTLQLQDCRAQIFDRWRPARRLAIAAGLIGIAAAAFALFPRWHNRATSHNAAPANIPEKSIAILPFENRSEDKENAFLADGMQDDVLTSLVQVKDLKVIGRSSVMSYRDAANRNLREIGRQLNVAHVLEGSVQRIANRLLVYVNLTDTRDGRSLWAERYDRTIADSTGLQGELAADIAGALRATLGPGEKARLQAGTTRNPDAYVLYLRGREYQMRPEVSQDNYLAAENFYKQAVTSDPSFALARARLAEMQLWLYQRFFMSRPARLAEARSTAEEALRLDPDCGQAHMVLAGCMMAAGDSTAATRREVAAAVSLLPNDAYIALAVAMLQKDMGWNDEAAASFERAMVLNPREGKVFYNYSTLFAERDVPDIPRARWASDRALELSPDSVYFRLMRAGCEFEWTGEVARGKAVLAGLPAGKDPDGRVTTARCTIALYERDFSEALRLLAACQLERIPFLDGSFGFGWMVPKAYVEGMVHFWAGHLQEAYASLDSARWMLEIEAQESEAQESALRWWTNTTAQAEAHYHLASTYAAMGWTDAAKAAIARSHKKPDPAQMATVFTLLGDHDSALPLLELVVSAWRPARTFLRWDPRWDSLRTDPRFQKLLSQDSSGSRADTNSG
jgi:serine/threonine protein kinase/Flp pilus assembly protein TadD